VVSPTHPGVYIEEIPNPPTIQGASTSIPAFVGIVGLLQTNLPTANTPTLVTSWLDYQSKFGGLAWNAYVSWAVFEFFQEGGNLCYVVALSTESEQYATANLPTPPGGGNVTALPVYAASPGKWPSNLKFNVLVQSVGSLLSLSVLAELTNGVTKDQILNRYIGINSFSSWTDAGNNNYVILEQYGGINGSDTKSLQALANRINKVSAFIRVGPVDKTVGIAAAASPVPFNTDGEDFGTTPTFASLADTVKGIADVSLLALPDLAAVTAANQGDQISAVLGDLCGQPPSGRNLFYVVDSPFAQDVSDIQTFKANLNSPNAALYYPWVDTYNPITGTVVPVPPSGAVLGRYAYTDVNAGPHVSPAGVLNGALRTVASLETYVSDADQDLLNPAGINAIRRFTNYGNVIYGARTLDATGEWTYIAVRRNFIFIEKSLTDSLQWTVFEPNTPLLWTRAKREISAFLRLQWNRGALFGNTEGEAFYVVCDETNNPPEARASGILYIDVGIAPVYPAEFVVIRLAQKSASPA
jgi:phage tail sheath protein FI